MRISSHDNSYSYYKKEEKMIASAPPIIVGAEIASSVMVASIQALYGTAKSINDFLNEHIVDMKTSDNHTVSRTGSVLEMAKYGFGIGFITPVAVIAAGQLILGNPLSAVVAVATSPVNPIAMTCAAVGAIYYGWNALSDQEKNEILEKLSKGLEIGVQLIKSIIGFIIEKTTELWTSENFTEIKKYISSAAASFGKTLGDVTNSIRDKVVDGFDSFKTMAGEAMDKTGEVLSDTYDVVKEQGEKVVGQMKSKKK
jgi:hypothetical protein